MRESHKKRKPTKKEAQNMIFKTFKDELKKNHIKGLVQGGNVMAKTILNYINSGKTIDEIKSFCEVTLHSNDTIENIASGNKEKEKENK